MLYYLVLFLPPYSLQTCCRIHLNNSNFVWGEGREGGLDRLSSDFFLDQSELVFATYLLMMGGGYGGCGGGGGGFFGDVAVLVVRLSLSSF